MAEMSVILLLFLVKTTVSTTSVYVVTVTSSFGGVYEEKRDSELHYKRIGEANNRGSFGANSFFLYTDSHRPQTWILGYGMNLSTARAVYRAPTKAARPAATQWSEVWGGSREGMEEGRPQPSIRVVGVETNITGEELEKK